MGKVTYAWEQWKQEKGREEVKNRHLRSGYWNPTPWGWGAIGLMSNLLKRQLLVQGFCIPVKGPVLFLISSWQFLGLCNICIGRYGFCNSFKILQAICDFILYFYGLPRGLSGKESICQAGDAGSIPGWGRYPGGANGSPLQCSCLGNPMDRGAWWAIVHVIVSPTVMGTLLSN